jgi:hypothetical protein
VQLLRHASTRLATIERVGYPPRRQEAKSDSERNEQRAAVASQTRKATMQEVENHRAGCNRTFALACFAEWRPLVLMLPWNEGNKVNNR